MLLRSSPSEKITMPFRPHSRLTRSIARTVASYSAVPPHAVLDDLEILLFQPAHELPAMGDDDRNEHGVGAHAFGVAEIRGVDAAGELAALGQRRNHADVMAADHVARIPGAHEGRFFDRARLPSIHEEHD